jgi:hypothetical protein
MLIVFQPVSAADPLVVAATAAAVPTLSHEATGSAPESIAVAKLTGAADRNGQPLVNGSIVSSGDSLSTHGQSALLLTSSPGERLWLGPDTSAKLTKNSGTVAVALERGTLGFESRGHILVTIEKHAGMALRTRPGTPVLAQLSLVNGKEAQVRLEEGSLELVQGSHSVLLHPEKSAAISLGGTRVAGSSPTEKSSTAQAGSAGQSDTGSITGNVVNSELFVVTGANITLTSASGKTLTAESDNSGKFSFTDVPPGTYTLQVVHSGFQSYELKDVLVRAGNESQLYVQMAGGGGTKSTSNNKVLLWVVIGGAAAGGIGAYLATRGSSSSTSPSTTQ